MKPSTVRTITSVSRTGLKNHGITSAVNIDDQQQEYIVYVAVPGMQREDFSISIKKRKLIISACKKEAIHCFTEGTDQDQPRWTECFTLPADADTVMTAAVYRNGELQIHIPKGNAEVIGELTEVFVY